MIVKHIIGLDSVEMQRNFWLFALDTLCGFVYSAYSVSHWGIVQW
jgi:hypothetical protein